MSAVDRALPPSHMAFGYSLLARGQNIASILYRILEIPCFVHALYRLILHWIIFSHDPVGYPVQVQKLPVVLTAIAFVGVCLGRHLLALHPPNGD